MLSIGAMGGGQAGYYIGLSREDYYQGGGEPPGVWYGQGARDLGLSGTVVGGELERLFAGFHPRSDTALIQNAGERDHQPGWDLTFSAPKSVSTLWSQASPETRALIEDAHFAAVKMALFYIEDAAAITRRGKGGHIKEPAHLVVATFEHGTSRAQDPQLHTHCLVMNACTRGDGTTGTMESKPLYKAKMTAGALYRAELAAELMERLDLHIERKGTCFEVAGVPQKLMNEFSKRRAEIEQVLDAKGYTSAQASAMATLATRQVKGHVSREELFGAWQETGAAMGWGQLEAGRFVKNARAPERDVAFEKGVALTRATERVTESQSYFTERDFLRCVAEEAQGRGFGAGAVLAIGRAHLSGSREIVPLGEYRGEAVYSTREMMALEKSLLDAAQRSKTQTSPGVSERTVEGVIATRRVPMADEQAAALRHITGGDAGRIRIVSGMAGTGKTTLLSAARLAWELEGFTVVGAALSGKAAKGLGDGARIESDTLHKMLFDVEKDRLKLSDRHVLVVDEAGMIGTRQMERLVTATEKSGARLVLVGDGKQLQPIEAGGPFKEMEDHLGSATLTGIKRQRDEWARDAVKDFAYGNARKALYAFAERGLLSVADDRMGAMKELVSAWKGDGLRYPEDSLIFAGTRAEAAMLNRLAQAERKDAGYLGTESVSAPGEADRFYVGDRVLFTKKSRLVGVENGSLGEVTSVDANKGTLTAQLDGGAERVTVSLADFPHVSLGYAVTTHKGQGATVERSFVLMGGSMQDREISYVQASRSRGETRIFTDKLEAGGNLAELARRASLSRQKVMAHTVSDIPRADPQPEITL